MNALTGICAICNATVVLRRVEDVRRTSAANKKIFRHDRPEKHDPVCLAAFIERNRARNVDPWATK